MKTCKDCVFLSNRRSSERVHVCLITGRYTIRTARACTHFDRPNNSPRRVVALGVMIRELRRMEVET